jgi:hypothetical protein
MIRMNICDVVESVTFGRHCLLGMGGMEEDYKR